MKKYSCRIFFTAIVAAFMSFAFVACGDDSTSASNDDTPVSSSEEDEILSSASADSSKANESECIINDIWNPGECPLSECTQKNEGQVETVWVGNVKYGAEQYYKCQNGSWVEGDIRLTCDTTGAQVGDICRKSAKIGYFYKHSPHDPISFYVYAGDGVWERYNPEAEITEECNLNNSGLLIWRVLDEPLGKKDTVLYECHGSYIINDGDVDDRSSWYMRITGQNLEDVTPGCVSEKPAEGDTCLFRDEDTQYNYRYKDGKWVGWNIAEENCATENVAFGDTCSFEWLGEIKYYMYVNDRWKVAVYDSKLGYCAEGIERNVESDGEYFSCEYGIWGKGDIRLACDTAGAQVGDICRKNASMSDFIEFYVYAGDGVWGRYYPEEEITEECNLNNSGLLIWRVLDEPLGKKDTVLYECLGGYFNNNGDVWDQSRWYMRITGLNLEDITPSCVSEKPAEGDTCSFRDEATQYNYRYKDGKWVGWDIAEENCATENVAAGDTCSFE